MKIIALLFACLLAVTPFSVMAEETAPNSQQEEAAPAVGDGLRLNVANVETIVSYHGSSDKSNIESMLPFSLEQDVRDWVKNSLIAGGDNGMLRVDITEASVKESSYEGEKRFFGLMSGPKMTRYEMALAADIKVYGSESLLPTGQVQVKAEQSGTIESNDAILNHEKLLRQLADKLLIQFDNQAREMIAQHLGNYISQ